ncbi:hypothetical protein MBLNU230_g0828t1 [Neophaeotheca triangularis]
MCHKAVCSTCQKTTWFGCGAHVPQVLDAVPEPERCDCEPRVEKSGKQYPPMGGAFGMIKGMFGMGGGGGGNSGEGKGEL